MTQAWLDAMMREGRFIDASEKAPGLFKPEAVKEAKERYYRAADWMQVWR